MHNDTNAHPIVVAAADSALAEEVATVIAATGRTMVTVTRVNPTDAAWRRAPAVIVDIEAAEQLTECESELGDSLFVVHLDGEEPDWDLAADVGASAVMALPSCGVDLVEELGRCDVPVAAPKSRPTSSKIGRSPRPALRATSRRGRALAIVPAVGGAGASVVAAAMAMGASKEGPAILVDADPYSGGADLLVGIEHVPGIRWPDVRAESGRLDFTALMAALPQIPAGPAVLTGSRSRDDDGWTITETAVASVVDSVVSTGGTAVVDVPGAEWLDEDVVKQVDLVVLVVPLTVRAVAAASRCTTLLQSMGTEVVAVTRGPSWGGVTAADVEYATGLEVIAELPYLKRLAREIENDGLGRSAGRLIRELEPVAERMGKQ
ncbi:septum site-determining protein Ssd [Corynebacterium sp. H113]|uniref:septum site-determining protein Ssd n=1 Tax=Corynebacterium sp. H113 TaxID=3133419 RepID=UPI0030A79B65